MRLWAGSTLVQIMACRLFGTMPLSKPMLGYCQSELYEETSVKFESKYNIFIHENACENVVCRLAAILSRRSWVMLVFASESSHSMWASIYRPVGRKCRIMALDGSSMTASMHSAVSVPTYSISQEICTRFLLCCALLWLYLDWFSHIHQAYFTGTVAI